MIVNGEMLDKGFQAQAERIDDLSAQVEKLSPEITGLLEQRRAILAKEVKGDLVKVQNQLSITIGKEWPTMYEMWFNDREREQLIQAGNENLSGQN